jgi:hypothetical protein
MIYAANLKGVSTLFYTQLMDGRFELTDSKKMDTE